eukprot:GEMP01065418.1.p1 GENE.GEMP01065418.1~~GEMP01065418.1.p1  ORF type:complete len:172 (+),score=32.75 GEMP01065418.1:118-633(+)
MRKDPAAWDSGEAEGNLMGDEYDEAMALNKKLREILNQGDVANIKNQTSGGDMPAGRHTVRDKTRLRQIEEGNQRLLQNLQGVTSNIPRSCTVPPKRETSQTVNRRQEARRVDSENLKLADRLENVRGSKIMCQKRGQDIPSGWTRGVGGRLLPPPKLRWGKRYDAGDWTS